MPEILSRWIRIAIAVALITTFLVAVHAVAGSFPAIQQPALRYGVAFAVVQTCVFALLVCGLIAYKQLSTRRDARKQRVFRAIEDALALRTEHATAIADRWPAEFMHVAQHALDVISGAEGDRIIQALQGSACYERMKRNISHHNPMLAAQAVRLLARTRTPEALGALARAGRHTSHVVRAVATREIIINGTSDARAAILDGLPKAELHQRLSVYAAINIESEEAITFLAKALQSGDPATVCVALEMVHVLGRMLPVAAPASLSQATDLEVRIKFYKALPLLTLTGEELTSVLKQGLSDEHWAVRAMAAKACGQYRAASLVDDLARICFTASVAAEAGHAAAALARLGGEARSRLQRSALAGSAYGHHAAAEVLQQSSLRGNGNSIAW